MQRDSLVGFVVQSVALVFTTYLMLTTDAVTDGGGGSGSEALADRLSLGYVIPNGSGKGGGSWGGSEEAGGVDGALSLAGVGSGSSADGGHGVGLWLGEDGWVGFFISLGVISQSYTYAAVLPPIYNAMITSVVDDDEYCDDGDDDGDGDG